MSGIERAVELVRELRDAMPAGWAADQATESKRQRLRDEAAAFLRDAREVEELPGDTGEPDHIDRLAKVIEGAVPGATPQEAAELREAIRKEDQRAREELPGDDQRPVYEIERDRHGLMFSGPLEVGECLRVVVVEEANVRLGGVRDTEPGDGQRAVRGRAWTVIEEPNLKLRSWREGDSIDAAFVVHDDDRCHYMRAREAQRLDETMERLPSLPDYHGGGVMRVRDTEREHEPHWTTTGRLDSGTGRHEWVCTCDERIWTDDPDGPEGEEPVYTNVTREVGDAIAAACDHYRRVGLQPTGTVVAGRVSDILGGRTEREHEPFPPMNFPAAQEVGEPMDYSPIGSGGAEREHESAARMREWKVSYSPKHHELVLDGPPIYGGEQLFVVPKTCAIDAEVLAKALDQFFTDARGTPSSSDLARLHIVVEPTLQALGYPKEAGS